MASKVEALRTTQIITFALCLGPLWFLGFALFTRRFAIDGNPDILCWIGLAFALAMVVLHWVIPNFSAQVSVNSHGVDAIRRWNDEERFSQLYPIFQTRHIIACALLEGAAFLNIYAYMQSACLHNLIVSVGLLIMITLRFPTLASAESWVRSRVEEMDLRS